MGSNMNWKNEKSNLTELIDNGLSYEEIGRRYKCTGSNIKRVCNRLGIKISRRRKINPSEHFNKGTGKKKYCKYCGKELKERQYVYCSTNCMGKYRHYKKVTDWLNSDGKSKSIYIPIYIKSYLMELHNNKCECCGWCKINPTTGLIPLEVHHIDGDYTNNKIENLQLLCPNCHSLTETYKSSNKLGRLKRQRLQD